MSESGGGLCVGRALYVPEARDPKPFTPLLRRCSDGTVAISFGVFRVLLWGLGFFSHTDVYMSYLVFPYRIWPALES